MKILFLIVFILTSLLFYSRDSFSQIEPADIYPHELAYKEAKYVVQARVVSFNIREGLCVEVINSVRGNIKTGGKLYVRGTAAFPFMNRPGTNVTLFIQDVHSRVAELWKGPTTGGMMWNDHTAIYLIVAALKDPDASLLSNNPREKLSAAYYLATSSKTSKKNLNKVVRAMIWGLEQREQEINQAAIEAFLAIDIDIQKVAGPYHPGHRYELKKDIAGKMFNWWNDKVTND